MAKKTSKKKKTGVSKKKTSKKKASVVKKSAAKKSSAKKKATSKKKAASSQVAGKTSKKKTSKKVAKKVGQKKVTKKKVAKKTAAVKKTTKKKTSKKKAAQKEVAQVVEVIEVTEQKKAKPNLVLKQAPKLVLRKISANDRATGTDGESISSRFTSVPMSTVIKGKSLSEAQLRRVKTGLSRADIKHYKQQLLLKRAEILGDVETLQSDALNKGGNLSNMPLHMADVGSDNYEQEFTLGLVESERKLLVRINEALERMAKGYYGVCIESGIPIGRERLDAKPWAKYCIEVVRDRESKGLPT